MKDYILVLEDTAGNTEQVDIGAAILRLINVPGIKLHIYRKTTTFGEVKNDK